MLMWGGVLTCRYHNRPPDIGKALLALILGVGCGDGAVNGNNSGDDADGACHDGGDLLVTMHQTDGRAKARPSLGAAVAELVDAQR